ncbi:MAG: aldehyde dehydrogenase family protein [Deltaproteobacteria bacterium]|jgi:acyl-CoA reductase-like NAD-dependent aldehyde dehydrogenase|nr:aldehyde dehydrogenase family protein [Deltaproteobacteria bacterium]TFG61337.1 MAG: aldehyde dehydrogenase family protein [Deltaproteobacteria bacterium]
MSIAKAHRLLVDGKWIEEKETMPVIDKYTGETIGTVPVASRETVGKAIAAAHEAFPSYSRLPAHRRFRILEKASRLLAANQEEIAATICREAGKAWKYSFGEVARAVETFQFSAEEAKRIHGETIPMDASVAGEGRMGFYLRCPVGVVSAITPFNFPLNLVAHKVGPALAAGCTVVLKPASTTPLTAIRLGEILEEAGIPPGVVNVVVGPGGTVGEWMTTDPRVAKVSFTGSPPVGEAIIRKAGLKKVTMELGNNSGTIIEPDADLDAAIPRCAVSAFANSGQVCISLQRLYVHRSIAEEFTRRFVETTAKLKVGNPLDRDCDVGPMIDEAEAVRAENWIREAVSEGAEVLIGGKREGRVLVPTVLVNARPEMKVMCQEAFAPLVSIYEYDSFEDAVAMVEDSPYGLQAGIYTNDLRKAMYAVDRINVGGVMINDTSIFRVDHMPYGGNKLSGLGREGVRFAVEEMTNIKMVVLKP